MTRAVLLVDENDERRQALAEAFADRGVPLLQVRDAFDAMASLGRADFAAVVLGSQRQELTLRGLAQLARRRHPAVRLVVIRPGSSDASGVAARLGVSVDVIAEEEAADVSAGRVLELMSAPVDPFAAQPTTDEVSLSVDRALQAAAEGASPADAFDGDAEVTRPDAELAELSPPAVWDAPTFVAHKRSQGGAASAERSPPPSSHEPLLEGVFEEHTGPALLMGIFAQDLTGVLEVSGGAARGTLYFHKGEPVAADHPEGNQGLLADLEARALVPAALDIRFVPEGELLATLVAAGNVTGAAMHAFLGGFVRERLFELVGQREGTYRFVEDRRFLDVAPLVRMNPFGIILERRRQHTLPITLQEEHDLMLDRWIAPRPALRLAAEKLRPFTRGRRVDDIIGSGTSVRAFLSALGLEQLMGALVLATLVDALLVDLVAPPARAPAPAPVELAAAPPPRATPPPASEPVGETDAALREEILSLYMRLKPVSHPRQLLGVPVWADGQAVVEAYRRRMRELDPRRIPPGNARAPLVAKVEELRAKVMKAMEALQFQSGARPGAPLPDVPSDEGAPT